MGGAVYVCVCARSCCGRVGEWAGVRRRVADLWSKPAPPPRRTAQIIGLCGAAMYWPLSLYLPIAMYVRVFQPPKHVRAALYAVSAVMLAVCLAAVSGAVRNIITSLQAGDTGL